MKTSYSLILTSAAIAAMLSACQPRTPAEKVQNAVEDAAHETHQGVNRAIDHVKDATN